jgi:hypothetical protein
MKLKMLHLLKLTPYNKSMSMNTEIMSSNIKEEKCSQATKELPYPY